jgi:hypothetical protein
MIVKIYFDSEIIFSEDVEKFHNFECSRTIKMERQRRNKERRITC